MQIGTDLPIKPAAMSQLVSLVKATQLAPGDADLHAGVASLLSDIGQFPNAVGAGFMATSLAPDSARAQAELGRALFLDGQVHAALEPCARAVTLAPDNQGARVTFGAVLFTLGRLPEALEAALESVRMDPGHFQSRANLALAYEGLGRLDEAEAEARQALLLRPSSPQARHNLASLRLSRGIMDAESWRLYEARLGLSPEARALAAIPRWSGQDVAGKTVLLHAEQGYGDVIQFIRYAPLVQARGARVVVAAPAPLCRLLSGMAGIDSVVEAGSLPSYDVFCPVASLPGIFATCLDTVPSSVPYLFAPPERQAFPAPPGPSLLQVGLVWGGNPGFVHDRFRSIPAERLAPLASIPGVQFHCLQKDAPPPFAMINRMATVTDFADTAALIARLDLVITVDTAVAHLAGAMGKPVWLLSRFMGCWRWLRDRDDSPWYPSMRLFRQERPNDWDTVIGRVRTALLAQIAQS